MGYDAWTEEDQAIVAQLVSRGTNVTFWRMQPHDAIDAEMAYDWRVLRNKGYSWRALIEADIEALEAIDAIGAISELVDD